MADIAMYAAKTERTGVHLYDEGRDGPDRDRLELLTQLRDAGVMPGAVGDFRFSEGYVLVQMEGSDEGLELPVEVASHIFLTGAAPQA